MKSVAEFRLPDAGSVKCYDKEGKEITPVPGDELWGQNGCFEVNPMSFTKLGAGGRVLEEGAGWQDGFRMVLDNNTGLVWETKSPKKGDVNFCGDRYRWQDAAKKYIKALNARKYGGFADWRLPNKDELRSIVDYGRTNPAVDPLYFPDTQSDLYWTSVPYNMQRPFVWGIFFGLGSGICYAPSSQRYVRAVRGGSDRRFGRADTTRFKDNGDGTVSDSLTGLMWQKEENERMDWYSALKSCGTMRLAGYSDWRLPNLKELNTILNLDYTNGWWYYKDFFPAKGLQPPLLHYFSSTPYEGIYVWVTNFCFGYDGYYASKNAKLLFRAVRNIRPPAKPAQVFLFPDSGMKKCYDDEGRVIASPKKGKRFDGQDGTYSINPLSFTKIGDSAVKDNNTGLVWEVKSFNKSDYNYFDNTYTWEEAKGYIETLNAKRFNGCSDWRLPNREELRSIVDYEGSIPAVNKKYFPDVTPHFYWSGDINKKEPIFAWGIYFAYGCAICYLRSFRYHVRAVRGGYCRGFGNMDCYAFKDNGDGTVTDLNTGLMWKKEESPNLNWEEAMRYCRQLDLGGYRDWRLPTIRELPTILDLSFKDGVWFHKQFFPGTQTAPLGFYWASTTYGDTFAWGENFQFGYDGYYAGKKEGKYPFRPVRNTRSPIRQKEGK